jgi:glycosyltransferase involved in cell wall biosynthesis
MNCQNAKVSIVIPAYNEEGNIGRTIDQLVEEGKKSPYAFEIIAVNDGSKDKTWDVIKEKCSQYKNVVGINQMTNYGQSQAYQAGFDHSTGYYIVTCSADLETPVSAVTEVVKKLDEGWDFVNTNRVGRWGGGAHSAKSGIANKLINKLTGLAIQDTGSGVKGFIAPIAKQLKFYGEMHRFIPPFISLHTKKIVEIDVEFQDRDFGVSSYQGQKKAIRVVLDLVTLWFLLQFAKKPFYAMPGRLFGFTGAIFALFGGTMCTWMVFERLFLSRPLADRPLFIVSLLTVLLGVVTSMIGMIGELCLRIYFECSGRKPYLARDVVGQDTNTP